MRLSFISSATTAAGGPVVNAKYKRRTHADIRRAEGARRGWREDADAG